MAHLARIRCSVYIAASVDGFIARSNGDLDWLPKNAQGETEDYGYKKFMNSIDCLVMGHNTYEKVRTFGDWPYQKPVIVLSSKKLDVPEDLQDKVRWKCGNPVDIVQELDREGMCELYIDGGTTIQQFIRSGLVSRMIISTVPILLGNGIPLFGSIPADITLCHVITKSFPNGIVQTEYCIKQF